jgi:hypothetical protein
LQSKTRSKPISANPAIGDLNPAGPAGKVQEGMARH